MSDNESVERFAAPTGTSEDAETESVEEEVTEKKSKSTRRKKSKVEVVLVRYGSWTDPQTGDEYTIGQPVEVDEDIAERLLGLGRQGGKIFDKTAN